MSTFTSIDSLRAASRFRRNTSGPNTAGSTTAPSVRSRPRIATFSRKVVATARVNQLNDENSNRRCWNRLHSHTRICIRHTSNLRRRITGLVSGAVLDLPLHLLGSKGNQAEEGGLDFYWHFCPKAGSGDGLRTSNEVRMAPRRDREDVVQVLGMHLRRRRRHCRREAATIPSGVPPDDRDFSYEKHALPGRKALSRGTTSALSSLHGHLGFFGGTNSHRATLTACTITFFLVSSFLSLQCPFLCKPRAITATTMPKS